MSGTGARLAAMTNQLSNQWQRTREQWKDAKCEEFDRQYIQELQASVDKAVTVMDQLDKLVNKIRSDCE